MVNRTIPFTKMKLKCHIGSGISNKPQACTLVAGGGAGKATISDLYFEHGADRSSPNLMKYRLTGKHIPEAVLVTRKSGGNPLEYMKITMRDVIVTGVHPICSEHGEGIREQVTLSFSKVTQEYKLQNAQGGHAGTVTASFDIKANQSA